MNVDVSGVPARSSECPDSPLFGSLRKPGRNQLSLSSAALTVADNGDVYVNSFSQGIRAKDLASSRSDQCGSEATHRVGREDMHAGPGQCRS